MGQFPKGTQEMTGGKEDSNFLRQHHFIGPDLALINLNATEWEGMPAQDNHQS